MSYSDQPGPELVEQLLRLENGELSDHETGLLIEALRKDPGHRATLIETLRMSQSLRAVGQKQTAEVSMQKRLQVPAKARRGNLLAWNLAAVVVASAVGLSAYLLFGENVIEQAKVDPPNETPVVDSIVPVENQQPTTAPLLPVESKSVPQVATVDPPVVSPLKKAPKILVDVPESKLEVPVVDAKETKTAPVLLGYRWSLKESSGAWYSSKPLMSGEHTIKRGSFKYRLINGVRFDVVGPTRFSLESVDKVDLISGKLAAEVPPESKGFGVDTKGAKVVDLGTRFAVTANEKGDSAVHVYEGVVEVTPMKTGGTTMRLESGDTRRLNLRTNRFVPQLFQSSLFVPSPSWTGSIEQISGNIVALDSPPESSDQASFQTGGFTIFPERRDVVLRRSLTPDLTESIRVIAEEADKLKPQKIPAKTKLATYLVRFSAKDQPFTHGEATIRFDSPVLGIIFNRNLLFATDKNLGAKQTQYPSSEIFRAPEKKDELEIAEDRRSVRLRFFTNGSYVDHARILVARD